MFFFGSNIPPVWHAVGGDNRKHKLTQTCVHAVMKENVDTV